ncbi:MAG TPA: MFS transporter [Peptococcaceae bacterium]|nr:MAG: Major facilitator superfamily MFS_1 [Clostridia bacterium 41_269]HBT19838.1 MFS transporter [Peptococcaceae bacterium]
MNSKPGFKLWFAVLNAVPFIMVLGNSLLIPILPAVKSAMNLSLFQVGLIITAFSIPAGLTIPFAGFASDHLGRKTIMAPALIIYGIGGLISGVSSILLAQPYNMIILGRIIQGIGAGGTYQLAMALTGDLIQSKERTKALGILEASNGLGKVISPIAGAALGLIAWFVPFFAYGILAIPTALAVWFLVKEPPLKNKGRQSLTQYWGQLKNIFKEKGLSLIVSFLSGMTALFILFGVLSWLSDILEKEYGIKGFYAGLLIAIPVSTMALTSYFSGSLFQQVKAKFLKIGITAGLSSITLSLAAISFVNNIYALFTALIFLGSGVGMVLPGTNTLITSAASSGERGLITCLYGSLRFFGVAGGPPVFGFISTIGKIPFFTAAAAAAAAAAILSFLFIRAEKMLPPQLLQER